MNGVNDTKRGYMVRLIENVFQVSDGIMVQFQDGMSCYYSAGFLMESAGTQSNQIFLDYDPSPMVDVPLDASPVELAKVYNC